MRAIRGGEPGGVLVPKGILSRAGLSSSDELVFGGLRVLCGHRWTPVASQSLADYVGIGLRTLHRSITALAKAGLIKRRSVANPCGRNNEYRIGAA